MIKSPLAEDSFNHDQKLQAFWNKISEDEDKVLALRQYFSQFHANIPFGEFKEFLQSAGLTDNHKRDITNAYFYSNNTSLTFAEFKELISTLFKPNSNNDFVSERINATEAYLHNFNTTTLFTELTNLLRESGGHQFKRSLIFAYLQNPNTKTTVAEFTTLTNLPWFGKSEDKGQLVCLYLRNPNTEIVALEKFKELSGFNNLDEQEKLSFMEEYQVKQLCANQAVESLSSADHSKLITLLNNTYFISNTDERKNSFTQNLIDNKFFERQDFEVLLAKTSLDARRFIVQYLIGSLNVKFELKGERQIEYGVLINENQKINERETKLADIYPESPILEFLKDKSLIAEQDQNKNKTGILFQIFRRPSSTDIRQAAIAYSAELNHGDLIGFARSLYNHHNEISASQNNVQALVMAN